MIQLYPLLAYVFVTTFTPGPNNILAMSNAMRDGYQKTFRFLLGIFSGFFVVMLVCGLLNFVLLNLLPQVKVWLTIFGAAYMVYLAVHLLGAKPPENSPEQDGRNSFLAGFGMQFLNLKVILYGITVFATFIIQPGQSPLTVSLFAPLLAAIGFVSTSCWALGGVLFRRLLQKYERWFNVAMAALLIYTALASLIEIR
jgi:cysteine/O-acetylserine efflux protein